MTAMTVTETDDTANTGPGPQAAADEEPLVQSLGPPGEDAAATELADLDSELSGMLKAEDERLMAEAKGGETTLETSDPDAGPPAEKPAEEPAEEPEEPAEAAEAEEPPAEEKRPTLTKARARMRKAREREQAAEQMLSQLRGQQEELRRQQQELAQTLEQQKAQAQLWATDPVKAFAQAAGANEDDAFARLAEHRMQHGTAAERAPKAQPSAELEAIRAELAELKKAREDDQQTALQTQRQAWLQQDLAACQRHLAAAPKETPYLAAQAPEEQAGALQRVLTAMHEAHRGLQKNPNDTAHVWVKRYLVNDTDDKGVVTATPVQKLLRFLDDHAKKRHTQAHERLQGLLPAAPADPASGGNGATSAGDSSSDGSGSKGERKLAGSTATGGSARRPVSHGEVTEDELERLNAELVKAITPVF